MVIAFLLSLRPKQWVKNLLLLAGLVFARRWSDPASVLHALAGFAVFCALSGVVYIHNDISDLAQDREHPRKRLRPIASGRISSRAAGVGAVALAVIALGASLLWLPLPFFCLALAYLLLTATYSWHLKHVAVLDILILAVGFVLRALAGIEVIRFDPTSPVEVTSYFLLTTLFLALFLATAKRRAELLTLGDEAAAHRRVLGEYSPAYLDLVLAVVTAGTLFSYALWATQGQFARIGESGTTTDSPYLLVLTMPFVVYGMFRYLWLACQQQEGGAPELVLLQDKPLLATVFLWIATVVAVLAHLT
jgi:4-hydroxybenzoate polyprenyltransferase